MKYATLFLGISILLACKSNKENPLFEKIKSEESGIDFINKKQDSDSLNFFDYLYFYNGGGVAAGDVNNDGYADLFFTSNQSDNKLYVNSGKGKIEFVDITLKAEIKKKSDYYSGVTMADINGDGWLDIYICAIDSVKGMKGKNELYINQGLKNGKWSNKFKEEAEKYGLDFSGFSGQASFFDYDHDGDLDCYLVNHAINNFEKIRPVSERNISDKKAGDCLFKNENGFFKNVSQKAGIFQSNLGFGLSVSLADFNNDGWEDIYVTNDFQEDDYFYLNQKNGTFKEVGKEYFAHFSRSSMGSDAADINNDGYQDILTLDMLPSEEKFEKISLIEDPNKIFDYKRSLGYYYQYGHNALQLSNQGKNFSEISFYGGVAATDWSWSVLFEDFDLDGWKDLFITNGVPNRSNDSNYIKFFNDLINRNLPQISQKEYYKKSFEVMNDGGFHNFIYKGNNTLQFEDKSNDWGFGESNFSNGAAYADLDNDGDMDLITNNINEKANIYKNNSIENGPKNYIKIKLNGTDKNKFGIGAKVAICSNGKIQTKELFTTRGFQSSVEPILNFGLGTTNSIDSLIVFWNNGKCQTLKNIKSNQTIVINQKNANSECSWALMFQSKNKNILEFTAELDNNFYENDYDDFAYQPLLLFKQSAEGKAVAIGDVNNDGLEDIYLGGASLLAGKLLMQNTKGQFSNSIQNAFEIDAVFEDIDAIFFDADKDKDLDLYIASGGSEYYQNEYHRLDRLYLNNGKGNFEKTINQIPNLTENKSCVKANDFDNDGDIDLFIGVKIPEKTYGVKGNGYLLENNGSGIFTKMPIKAMENIGLITDAQWFDYDNDKDNDLVVVGEWMPVTLFENKNKSFEKIEIENSNGFWQSIQIADFDLDGNLDLVVGNIGLNSKLVKSNTPKLQMYVADFDGNSNIEQVVCYNREDKFYPLASRDELGKVMPGIIFNKFTDYYQFAGKSIDEILEAKLIKKSIKFEINEVRSIILYNKGKKHFEKQALPKEAQYSIVKAMVVKDLNNDKRPDLIIGGNTRNANSNHGGYDAFAGISLINKLNKEFEVKTDDFNRNEDINQMKFVTINKKENLLIKYSNKKSKIFQFY